MYHKALPDFIVAVKSVTKNNIHYHSLPVSVSLRLFTVGEDSRKVELLWENFYHQRCVLSVASYSLEDPQGKQ